MRRIADEQTKPRGYLEPVRGNDLRGWVHAPGRTDLDVEVLVNGKPFSKGVASRPRLDLGRIGIYANCGFLISLDALPKNRTSAVSARVTGSKFDFGGQQRTVCPAVLRRAEEIRAVFHADGYQSSYELSFENDEAAFAHFLHIGVYEGFDPNPWFDSEYFRSNHRDLLTDIDMPLLAYLDNERAPGVKASAYFDPAFYLARYPDLKDCGSLLAHYTGHGHREGRYAVELTLPVPVRQELEELIELESALPLPDSVEQGIVRYPFLNPESFVPGAVKRRFGERIQAVVCVPYLTIGGGDLYASLMLRAFQERFGADHVLLVVTDQAAIDARMLIDDSTQIHFLLKRDETLTLERKICRLHGVIGALAPRKVHNMNSQPAWELYRRYGRQLSSVTDLYANMFCLDSGPNEPARGYIPDYARDTIDWLAAVFTDNRAIVDYIAEQYRFSDANQAKLVTLYAPCLHDFPVRLPVPATSGARPKVLWCGRLAHQKRPDRLLELAGLMPALDFHVYGPAGNSTACEEVMKPRLPNLHYEGTFDSLDELDLSRYAMFLNTSDWDGLANILIQIAKAGVPIVSSRSGGIGELIDEDSGWLVADNDDTDAYLTYMRSIVIDRAGAEKKARRAASLVARRHTWAAFMQTLESEGAFDLERAPIGIVAEPIDRRRYRDQEAASAQAADDDVSRSTASR